MNDDIANFKLDFASVMVKLARANQNDDHAVLEPYEVKALLRGLMALTKEDGE